MKKIMFAAAEAVPFVKTGGLADVIGSLPRELKRQGLDVRIVLPLYANINYTWREKMTLLKIIQVPVGWRKQYCGIHVLEQDGLTYYFIDNEYYFKRPGLYGYYDDGERFSYFCRAVLDMFPHIDFIPDVLHCHDWHAAITPVLLKAHYSHREEYSKIRTVLSIHNIQYQGIFSKSVLGELLGLDEPTYFSSDKLEFYGSANFLKGGIAFADAITAVSETYAEEIVTPEGGRQLDGMLRARQDDLFGIVNGIDYESYNPQTDSLIDPNYTWRSLNRKQDNKTKLQEHVGLPVNPEVPLVGIVTRLVAEKGLDLIAYILDELLEQDIQMVLLGTGEEKYESMFRVAAYRYPEKFSANIYFDDALARKIYAGSDIYLMPSLSEPCGISQLIALRYGSVPVVRETGGLKDTISSYNEYTGAGNGFSFTHINAHDMLYTINRALKFYYEKDVWAKIVRAGMKTDYSWQRSASEYAALYDRLK